MKNRKMMLLATVTFFTICARGQTGGQLQPNDIVIITSGAPIPDYLLQGPYKFAPTLNSVRAYRRNDDSGQSDGQTRRNSRRGMDKRTDQNLRIKTLRRPTAQMSSIAARRSDKNQESNVLSERLVKRVNSSEGPVTVPFANSQEYVGPTVEPTFQKSGRSSQDINDSSRTRGQKSNDNDVTSDASQSRPIKNTIAFPPPTIVPVGYQPIPAVSYKSSVQPLVLVSEPQPYGFGYDVDDGLGSTQYRQESTTGNGVITGNYGYKDYQGVFRQVNYVADKDGFRAVMRTNEPSVIPIDSADVGVIVDPPSPAAIAAVNKYTFKSSIISNNKFKQKL